MQYWIELIIEKLQFSTKYPLKFGKQENLTTLFSDYETPSTNDKS